MYTWGYIKNATLSKLDLDENEAQVQNLISRFPYYANEVMTQVCSTVKPKRTYKNFIIDDTNVGALLTMPDDFVAFGDDVNYELIDNRMEEIYDTDFAYQGYNQVVFARPGNYYISYNARWYDFQFVNDSVSLNIPTDILDCIPSYIASQCFKIDDEYKAQVFRNEYEMLLARIDDTNYKNTKTILIKGDW